MDWFGTAQLARLRRRSTSVVVIAVAALLVSSTAAGQDSRGSIGGRVADSSGGVLPGVTVTIVNNGTNATTVVVTGEGGVFTAPFLISGSYRVTVELPGFRTTVREKVDVRVGDRLQVDFALEPAKHRHGDHRGRDGAAPRYRHRVDGPGDRQQADRRDAARRRHRLRPGAAGPGRVVRTVVRAAAADGQRQPARPHHQRHHQQRVHHRRLEQHRVRRARRHPAALGFDPGVQGRDRRLRRADRPHRCRQRQPGAQERQQPVARRCLVLQP